MPPRAVLDEGMPRGAKGAGEEGMPRATKGGGMRRACHVPPRAVG